MGTDEFKKADLIIRYSLRAIIGLGIASCAIVFNSMREGISDIGTEFKTETREIRDRMMRMETKMEAQAESDRKRDDAIEEIRKQVVQTNRSR